MSFGSNWEFPNTSYYDGDLRELIEMYKKLTSIYQNLKDDIDKVTEFIDNFSQYVKEEIDKQLTETIANLTNENKRIRERLTAVEGKVSANENDIFKLYQELTDLNSDLNAYKIEVNILISKIYSDFGEYKDSIDSIIQSKLNELKLYIDEIVTKIDRLYVIDPFTGELENIQIVIDKIASYLLRGYGLTAQEYDDMSLKAADYDSRKITAIDYSTRGYFLFFKDRIMLMRSPFTGQITTYEKIINQLADLHRNSYTAQEYDNLVVEAMNYDNLAITAYNYDWNSKQYL